MRSARPLGLLLSAAAVVLWAFGVTVLQPLTELIGVRPTVLFAVGGCVVLGVLAAAPARSESRVGLAAGVTVAALLGVGLVRAVPPETRLLPEMALGAVLLTGVTLLAWPTADNRSLDDRR
ncbi:hypothetical protein [Micromonospora lupini]|uniref:Major facilitator superfamily MFS_1 permease n=1 Tax=Micromonospora lupini str. Lupac 08 TaxID=1150864 RepID=I0KXJ3_9ACTN|nr:hypothetical protein [Micromonospora lupini]CCH16290.1 Major facilitator superfamily MFS_1 permease [Micromonospora lupini str. Lupac 08]